MRYTLCITSLLLAAVVARAQSDPVIEPERFSIKPGSPLGQRALIASPPQVGNAQSWSWETRIHRGRFAGTAVSPDGKKMATGGLDGSIRLWDLETGKLIRILIGHDQYVYTLAFSPGGKYLASGGSADGGVRIWDLATGYRVKMLRGQLPWVTALAWSRDGRSIAGAGGPSGYCSVWELGTGSEISKCQLGRPVITLALHPETNHLAAITADSLLGVYEASSGKVAKVLGEAGKVYTWIDWSPNGKQIAGGMAKATLIYNWPSGDEAKPLEGACTQLTWNDSADRLAIYSAAERLVRVWDPAKAEQVGKASLYLTWMRFMPGSKQLAYSDGLTIGTVGTEEIKELKHEVAGTGPPLWTSGRPVVKGVGTNSIHLWDAITGKPAKELPDHPGIVTAFAWSGDGKALATIASDKVLRVFDVVKGVPLFELSESPAVLTSLAWSADGKDLAAAGRDKVIRVWNGKTGDLVQTLSPHDKDITVLSWSASGNTLAVGEKSGATYLYPRATWKQSPAISSNEIDSVASLAWTPDGKMLAVGDTDGSILFTNPATRALLFTFPRTNYGVYSMTFFPKGDVLAIANYGYAADLWSPKNQKRITTLPTQAPVTQVAWNNNPPLLAASASDRCCRFFEPVAGKLRGILIAEADHLLAMVPEGHYRADVESLEHLFCVVQTDRAQETLTPGQFAMRFGWKNNPAQAKFK